jgi:hypothetical protein
MKDTTCQIEQEGRCKRKHDRCKRKQDRKEITKDEGDSMTGERASM